MIQLQHRPFSRPADSLRKAVRAVDEEVGIVRRLFEAPVAPDSPRVFAYGSLTGDLACLGYRSDITLSGSTSLVRDQAIAGAVGESIERYSAAFVPYEDLVVASSSSLNCRGVPPWSLTLYDEDQYRRQDFRYKRPTERDTIAWAEGFSLTKKERVLVPAFAVYMPYQSNIGEFPIVQQITTGLACGNTIEEAILSAVCEVAERDAAMLTWLQSRRPPRVVADPDGVAFESFGALCRYVTVLDATSDLDIPSYIAIWDGPIGNRTGSVFCSSASLSAKRAFVGALTELAQCMAWVNSLIDRPDFSRDPLGSEFSRIEDHVMWPTMPSSRSIFKFMLDSSSCTYLHDRQQTGGTDVLDDIQDCVDRIGRRGLEVIVVDVTAPDVREIGFHVVRVIIPGAQPLFFGSKLHRISDRARFNLYAGCAPVALNLHPHPFP